jgi:diaminohydroxyphosphoribosylaminopyrimidine deaminase/5-amino-6-(5-phosphoribosylamino)uracil reductase
MHPALKAAFEEAEKYRGATAPNPPVGAAATDQHGRVLATAAHVRAGTAHAEAALIAELRKQGGLERVDSLWITLEPCNHTGQTPPCTQAIVDSGIRKVFFGTQDPNPKVQGGGAAFLRENGIEVTNLQSPDCQRLIAPFAQWSKTGIPWVTVKSAHQKDGSMIPPPGKTTFTSELSLRLAHELRKRADAILTGSGTILADCPQFTVRWVQDHPGKRRHLAILDRRKRVLPNYSKRQEELGFSVTYPDSIEEALESLGKLGCLEVLVEAGPTLTQVVLSSGIWNEHVVITQGTQAQGSRDLPRDLVQVETNVHWNYSKPGTRQPTE